MNNLLNMNEDKEEFKILNKLITMKNKFKDLNTKLEIDIKKLFSLDQDNKYITP